MHDSGGAPSNSLRRCQPRFAALLAATALHSACTRSESVLFEDVPTTGASAHHAGVGAASLSGSASGGAPAAAGLSGAAAMTAGTHSGGSLGVAGTGSAGAEAGGEAGQRAAEFPADILDLTRWQLSLPIPSASEPEHPTETIQPQRGSFALAPSFTLSAARDGVLLRATAGDVSVRDSSATGTLLRETAYGGAQLAAWSTRVGQHPLFIRPAILALPRHRASRHCRFRPRRLGRGREDLPRARAAIRRRGRR